MKTLPKRIIFSLNFLDGILYRSRNFIPDYRYTHNFIDLWSIDEIVILDITRDINFQSSRKKNFIDVLNNLSKNSFVPFSVGGHIKELNEIETLLKNGADKVVLNSITYENKNFIKKAAKEFGSSCIVVSIDAKLNSNTNYDLYSNNGSKKENVFFEEHVKEVQDMGAGEIFLQSIDKDGTLEGFDLNLINYIKNYIKVPFIISSGAGSWKHFLDVFKIDAISGAATSNIFHFTEKSINNFKELLKGENINIR